MANMISWTGKDGEKDVSVVMHVGDVVRVHYRLIEKEKVAGKTKREVKEETRERIQIFEGILIAIKGSGQNAMFTVRKIGAGAIGIERIFPLLSPWIRNIEVKRQKGARRSKLYFLRGKLGKEATRVTDVISPKNSGV